MQQAAEEKKKLLQLIHDAFENVTLGQGVSLHQTVVIDNYGSPSELAKARQGDEKQDWTKLVNDPELKAVEGIGGLSFFDAEGLRFHLPAYMCLALDAPFEEVVEGLVFTLTSYDDYQKKRFQILNPAQREAVKAFLIYLRDFGGEAFEFDRPKIDEVLAAYWH